MSDKAFRYRSTWRGKLVLQISYRSWHPYLGMMTYWRDARVEDIEAIGQWNIRHEADK